MAGSPNWPEIAKQAGTEGPPSRSVRYRPRFAKARETPQPPRHQPPTTVNKVRALDTRRKAALDTPTDLSEDAVKQISAKLSEILATTFALYIKTKNFHWHVSGPHFRDYHLLLDEQGEQILTRPMTSPSAPARSAARPSARSAKLLNCKVSRTTTRARWRPATCCAS
jgi:hypothetical protein